MGSNPHSSRALVVSIVLHAAAAAVLLALPASATVRDRIALELELDIVIDAPEEAAEIEGLVAPRIEAPVETARTRSERPRASAGGSVVAMPAPEPIAPEPIDVAPDPVTVDEPVETEQERRDRLRPILAPDAVARSAYTIEGAPSRRGAPQPGATIDRGAHTETEIERDIDRDLQAHAAQRPWTEQGPPRTAVPQLDGTYVYVGPEFVARIAADGSVRFEDASSVRMERPALEGEIDITGALMRAQGADPLAAERAEFMEDNAELIAHLEREHFVTTRARFVAGLPGRLAAIWQRDASPEARRREIFEMWDEIEESGDRTARDVIEAFVRRALVGADAYSRAELARLNASRTSTERFDPYR